MCSSMPHMTAAVRSATAPYRGPLCDQIEIPALSVLAHVNVISQG